MTQLKKNLSHCAFVTTGTSRASQNCETFSFVFVLITCSGFHDTIAVSDYGNIDDDAGFVINGAV